VYLWHLLNAVVASIIPTAHEFPQKNLWEKRRGQII
jgi:hypothetical protein